MGKTLINAWLTFSGPIMFVLVSLGCLWVALYETGLQFHEFVMLILSALTYALTAWGLFNRIWNRS